MKIHYKKVLDSPGKIISGVLYVQIIDGEHAATVLLKNGQELNIKFDRIELCDYYNAGEVMIEIADKAKEKQ